MHHLLIILDLKHLFLPDCSLVLISTLLLNTKVLLVKAVDMLFYSPCYKNVWNSDGWECQVYYYVKFWIHLLVYINSTQCLLIRLIHVSYDLTLLMLLPIDWNQGSSGHICIKKPAIPDVFRHRQWDRCYNHSFTYAFMLGGMLSSVAITRV